MELGDCKKHLNCKKVQNEIFHSRLPLTLRTHMKVNKPLLDHQKLGNHHSTRQTRLPMQRSSYRRTAILFLLHNSAFFEHSSQSLLIRVNSFSATISSIALHEPTMSTSRTTNPTSTGERSYFEQQREILLKEIGIVRSHSIHYPMDYLLILLQTS